LHGTNLTEVIALRCVVCGKFVAVRIDPVDLRRHHEGLFVQFAFPYLDASLRELFISGVCPDCWDLLCPDPIVHPTAYH
jgi:hypothetical protein